ncbi:helix-turn-helix domain-containing protein [Isoptericola sp. b441]|uniref:Helix-turn-helix domain-containing protein n=1 Tax=Actinotalea lenta TaxID=3064654 RepID=A0ABT9D9E4_9CELL|nr:MULTISPECIES: TetR/AcrR family transcriptional regulator [unclassified Isoptericola]MDO8107522.1 helix-turn-helix domain-containing protein [Isoptericola sp. b441]MDO8120818.1 helix-turn-helix domain-containing protein [Isoptericola sp. b490]
MTSTESPPAESTGSRTRLSPEDRRAAILDATVPLLVQHGVALTTRQIADAAGVAEGTLFRVFDDKRALVVAAIAHALDPLPVVAAIRGVDARRALDAVLYDVVDVVRSRSEGIRGVMSVAHELRRSAGEQSADGMPHSPFDHEDPAVRADLERPGSLVHAAHQLRSKAGRAPQTIVAAVADVLGGHRQELRRDPAVCARILFSIVTSSFHDPLGPADQLSTREIVEVFLDGMRARPDTSPENPC